MSNECARAGVMEGYYEKRYHGQEHIAWVPIAESLMLDQLGSVYIDPHLCLVEMQKGRTVLTPFAEYHFVSYETEPADA